MKINIVVQIFLLFMLNILCENMYAFESKYTHPAITEKATVLSEIDTYLQSQLGCEGGLNTQLHISNTSTSFVQDLIDRGMDHSLTTRNILEWLREGSKLEDAKIQQARSQHHFHDPIRNAGLDNRTDNPNWWGACTIGAPFDLKGESALDWTITGTSSTGYPKNNQETWSAVRNKFYDALTSSSKTDREQYLAETFLALGHILHMLEDMGVPAHARNDFLFGHYRYSLDNGNYFEGETEKKIKKNKGISLWAGSSPVVFSKLADYFDSNAEIRNINKTISESYLGDEVLPLATWGLSEATNYQFLSYSTIFKPNDGSHYYFPHPAKENMGTAIVEESEWSPETYKRYFNGENYGVSHLARESYTYYKMSVSGYSGQYITDITNTVDDEQVIIEYANISIPRTINYTAGLINYFFRGKLKAMVTGDGEIMVTNISENSDVQQMFKDGVFELYWDDQNGVRTLITTLDFDGNVMAFNETIVIEFTPVDWPEGRYLDTYVVVYKGKIQPDENHSDPDDNQALAVTTRCEDELMIFADTPYAFWCECGPNSFMLCGDLTYVIDVWNFAEKSGRPQNLADGVFDIYYKDMEGQLILLDSVAGSLGYCYDIEEDVLQIDLGLMDWTPAQRIIVIYRGQMTDSENPSEEYEGMTGGSRGVDGVGPDTTCYMFY